MYWTECHLLACNASHCVQKGANDVAMILRREVMKRGLDAKILVNNCGTIDLCDIGPNIVVYPAGVIYSGVTKQDVPEIVEALTRGEFVERLVLNRDTPAEANRRDFYAAALAAGPAMPIEGFAALAEHYDLDAAWIAEQQRRGFIARKPSGDDGQDAISLTKKARDRYELNT